MLGAARQAHVGAAGAAGAAAADARNTTTTAPAEDRGTGGDTSYTAAALVEWRRRAAAPVEDRSRRTNIEGARGRSHGPAAELPELRLGKRGSTHRWTGTACRAAPIACQTGVRRGTSDGHDWIGSKAVEITGSRVGRADQDVPLLEF
jgi:hypothetical protein